MFGSSKERQKSYLEPKPNNENLNSTQSLTPILEDSVLGQIATMQFFSDDALFDFITFNWNSIFFKQYNSQT